MIRLSEDICEWMWDWDINLIIICTEVVDEIMRIYNIAERDWIQRTEARSELSRESIFREQLEEKNLGNERVKRKYILVTTET